MKCIVCKKTQPNFGYENDEIPTHCSKCKKDNMVDIRSKKCIVCKKTQPNFGYEKATHCSKCKKDNMVDIKNKKCIVCKKTRPSFGYEKATHCSKCKKDNMININSKKCIICKKTHPIFGYENDKIPTHCSKCKKDNMIDIKSKKCIVCKKTQPIFGYENDKIPTHCSGCKKDNMININSKKCIVCKKTLPSFGYENDKIPTHCNICKKDNMIDIRNNKCIVCKKIQPIFGYENDKAPTHCNICKKDNMIDIRHNKCKANESPHNILCPSRANKNYDNFCGRCYTNLFPDTEKAKNYRFASKELKVVSHILDHFNTECKENSCLPKIHFIHDKPLYVSLSGGCCTTKRRMDLYTIIDNTILAIEIDENQHSNYDEIDEENRYNDLYMNFSGKYVFIRYNPDSYKENNERKNPSFEDRMEVLIETINECIDSIKSGKNESSLVEIKKLFYNN